MTLRWQCGPTCLCRCKYILTNASRLMSSRCSSTNVCHGGSSPMARELPLGPSYRPRKAPWRKNGVSSMIIGATALHLNQRQRLASAAERALPTWPLWWCWRGPGSCIPRWRQASAPLSPALANGHGKRSRSRIQSHPFVPDPLWNRYVEKTTHETLQLPQKKQNQNKQTQSYASETGQDFPLLGDTRHHHYVCTITFVIEGQAVDATDQCMELLSIIALTSDRRIDAPQMQGFGRGGGAASSMDSAQTIWSRPRFFVCF